MNLFSISQLALFSGIKPHTIRMWEQRYKALNPTRSVGNTRYYGNSELRRLLNIVSLSESGYRVSELCVMNDEALFSLIRDAHHKDEVSGFEYYISQLIASGMNYDQLQMEQLFEQCLGKFGIRESYSNIIYPMLERVGVMWTGDMIRPAHEHFISNIIRQKLLKSTDALPQAEGRCTWLLFLPEDEFHEIGLLFAQYLIRQAGDKVIYFGGNVPFQSVVSAIQDTSPEYLLTFFVHYDHPDTTESYLDKLQLSFAGKMIYASGNQKLIGKLSSKRGVEYLDTIQALEKALTRRSHN